MVSVSIKWLLRLTVDLICIYIALMPSMILNEDPLPYVRGFHCNDMDIKYPSKEASMNDEAWVALNFLPIVMFGIGELSVNPHHFNQTFYRIVTTYLFGAFSSNSMTHLAKYYIGHLRPHFLDVCDLHDCKGFIEHPECNAPDLRNVIQSRLSFYSFHSSHAMYSMAFTAMYVESRMKGGSRWTHLLRPAIQANLIVIAMGVGYSRAFDNKNHLNDVLLGLLQGGVLAFLIVYYLFPDTFKVPEAAAKSDEQLEQAHAAQVP